MVLHCPLCSASLAASGLEAHLRFELTLPLLKCMLCRENFCDQPSAANHFHGPFAKHPGATPQLMQPPNDEAKTGRLLELLRLARGGEEAVQERLCVCGQCRLLCREDFRPTSAATKGSARATSRPLDSDAQHRIPAQLPARDDPAGQGPLCQSQGPGQREADWALETGKEDPALPVEVKEQNGQEQNMTEASEEESPTPVDMKPNLADLKPKLVSDGKVACLQCGSRVNKNHFSQHARTVHMPGKPFQCLLCPLSTKQRQDLAKHQTKEHGTGLSPETYASSLNKEAVRDWIKLCFGEAKDVSYSGSRCRPCDVHVPSQRIKQHVATQHLKKPLHRCRQCGQQSNEFKIGNVRKHVKNVHKGVPGPETIDSSALEQYEPIIKAMIPQLFDK